ncbi:MAG: hypothetical protein GF350_10640 [Chitinivibrionales bacterium]|nr:hypothetical protein [Chitinivibrionales bacterium]
MRQSVSWYKKNRSFVVYGNIALIIRNRALKFRVVPCIVLSAQLFGAHAGIKSSQRPQFGIYYAQAANNLFMAGVVQKDSFQKAPLQYFIQLGYAYDTRHRVDYKEFGHGLVMDNSMGPFFKVDNMAFGMFAGMIFLFEAYKITGVDAFNRERNAGVTTGFCVSAFHNFSLKAGILQAWELSNFFMLWEKYPLSVYVSVLVTG